MNKFLKTTTKWNTSESKVFIGDLFYLPRYRETFFTTNALTI